MNRQWIFHFHPYFCPEAVPENSGLMGSDAVTCILTNTN